MATVQDIPSAEQLLSTPSLGQCELVCGELNIMSPSGLEHGAIVGLLTESFEPGGQLDSGLGAFVRGDLVVSCSNLPGFRLRVAEIFRS